MPVTSYHFIFLLLPITLIIFHISKMKFKKGILLIANIIFLFYLGLIPLLIIILSGFIYYLGARMIQKFESKFYFILPIVLNILVMIFFKYNSNLVNLLSFTGVSTWIQSSSIFIPLGISFYTFQGIAYISDVYNKKIIAEKNSVDFFSFFLFFGTITSGPIIRYSDFKLVSEDVDVDEMFEGLKRIIFGLIKKLYLSSRFAFLTDTLWNHASNDSALAWIATISFTLQIFLDFSGYSDISIGVSKCLGFKFKENFNYPYTATSLTDFWRRWHISLSLWFRDYIYIPLGGNRVNVYRMVFNMLVVWLLTGIWHGSTLTFIIWGLFNFVIILFERFFFIKVLDKTPKLLQHMYALIVINLAWVFFRSGSVMQSLGIIKSMFSFGITIESFKEAFTYVQLYKLDWLMAILVCTPYPLAVFNKLQNSKNRILRVGIYTILGILLIIGITLVISSSYQSFLYEAF